MALEIRRNDDGSLDEIVGSGCRLHMEQMDHGAWWIEIEVDGTVHHVNLTARSKISAVHESYPAKDAGER